MIKYLCPKCDFTINQSDKAWDVASISGACPKCNTKLPNFHVIPASSELTKETDKEPKSENKHGDESALVFFVLFICAISIAVLIDDENQPDRGLIKLVFKLLEFVLTFALSLGK